MANARLPHLQRPSYQPENPIQPKPVSRPASNSQKLNSETLPRPHTITNTIPSSTRKTNPASPTDSQNSVKEKSVSNPRFLRLSLTTIPLNSASATSTGLPIGGIWQPFAEIPAEEDQICVSDSFPFRCTRCMGYVNAFFKFIDSGRKCICNLCGASLDTPEMYLRDRIKVELCEGSYEFRAPAEYSNRPVQVPLFLFCVDISVVGLGLGLIQQVTNSIRAILDYLPDQALVGVIGFDIGIHVFKLSNTDELCEIITNDLEDPFVSESVKRCCFSVGCEKEKFEILLEKIANGVFNGSEKSLSVGAVVYAVKEHLLKRRGGRVIVFVTQGGEKGKYGLVSRPDTKFIHSEKEKGYLPTEDYVTLAQECCQEDVCIDIFACVATPISVSTLSFLCSQTGGDFYHFPFYTPENDFERLYYQITRILTRPQCIQITARVRCTAGLSIDSYIGKFKRRGPVEMEIPCLDSDKAFGILLKYDENLMDNSDYFIQTAMIYTSTEGERRIRIHNSKLTATKSLANVLFSADIDAVNTLWLKIAANSVFELSLNEIRHNWHRNLIKVLVTHRQTLGDMDFSKILLPETLKLLPLYCNASLKLPGLSLQNVSTNKRLTSIHRILGLSVLNSRLLVYPKIYQLHSIGEENYASDVNDCEVVLPKLISCSVEFIKSEGVYLMLNGERFTVVIGKNVDPKFFLEVWGVEGFSELFSNPEVWAFRDLGTEVGLKVFRVVEEIKKSVQGSYPAVEFYFEDLLDPVVVKEFLQEDSNSCEVSYYDFFLKLHKVVVNKIRKE